MTPSSRAAPAAGAPGAAPRFPASRAMPVILIALTLGVFGQVARHEFVRYDDNLYLTENPVVREGLTLRGVAWAFTQRSLTGNYHPLT